MARINLLVPFILKAEGGLSDVESDAASANPCPYKNPANQQTGYHTNKGITWPVFVSYFGNTPASGARFFAMDTEDWTVIFKKEYWDKFLGDSIKSDRVANVIGNLIFMAGRYYPELDIEKLLNNIFNAHLAQDGIFGPAVIASLNSIPEEPLYNDLLALAKKYFTDLATSKPQYKVDLDGWLDRLYQLEKWNLLIVSEN